jgi:hydrogenase nickel incorporation protein HypB
MEIKVLRNILGVNEQIAQKNHEMLDKHKVFAINIMASPGAGKTSLVLRTITALQGKTRVGVIEGDISSTIDAEAVGKTGVPVVQINTGGECHLDANMIQSALNNLPLQSIDLLLIENVGNLVCPAEFNLGEHLKILVASVPEGDDKPHKYPGMFNAVDAVILNKTDLLPYVKFNVDSFTNAVRAVNKKARIFQMSCTSGAGIPEWVKWLRGRLKPEQVR